MTERIHAKAAALLVAAAFVFGFGMFTIAFSVTFDSVAGMALGIGQVGVSFGTLRRERQLASPKKRELTGGAA